MYQRLTTAWAISPPNWAVRAGEEYVKDHGLRSRLGDWLEEQQDGLNDWLTVMRGRATPPKMKVFSVSFTLTRRPTPPGPAAEVTAGPGEWPPRGS